MLIDWCLSGVYSVYSSEYFSDDEMSFSLF